MVPGIGMSPAELETMDAVLMVGSDTRREVPMLAHRLGKLGRAGGALSFCNARAAEWLHPLHAQMVTGQRGLVAGLAAILDAACEIAGKARPTHLSGARAAPVDDTHRSIARSLVHGDRSLVMLGLAAARNTRYSDLRAVAAALAAVTGARYGELTEGANTAGGYLAGVLPHRAAGGAEKTAGLGMRDMLEQPRRTYLLVGVEPETDTICGGVVQVAMDEAETVIAAAPFLSEYMREYVDLFLPTGTVFETSGTFVNASGDWQSFRGAMRPVGQSRPTWKVLRVLGNHLDLDGFDHKSSEEVLAELELICAGLTADPGYSGRFRASVAEGDGLIRVSSVPLYASDMLVRRSRPLQETTEARGIVVRMSPADAVRIGIANGHMVAVANEDGQVTLDILVDAGVADGDVWVPVGVAETLGLSGCDLPVEVAPL